MIIIFRVDSGHQLGSGHLMRCRNLAFIIKERYPEAVVKFLVQDLPGNLNHLLESDQNWQVVHLPQTKIELKREMNHDTSTWLGTDYQTDLRKCLTCLNSEEEIDLLVVDHYAIDHRWETSIKNELKIKKLMVLDDLYNRQHSCDYLLDQTLYLHGNPYQQRDLIVYQPHHYFMGPKYILLNSLFSQHHLKTSSHRGSVKNIQIMFGGADLPNETLTVINHLLGFKEKLRDEDLHFHVVIGPLHQAYTEINDIVRRHHDLFTLYHSLKFEELCQLLLRCDLCIGAGGVSLYERCCLGVPTITINLAENQTQNAVNLLEAGAISFLGMSDDYTGEELKSVLQSYLEDPEKLIQQSRIGRRLVDGLGCQRVVDKIFS